MGQQHPCCQHLQQHCPCHHLQHCAPGLLCCHHPSRQVCCEACCCQACGHLQDCCPPGLQHRCSPGLQHCYQPCCCLPLHLQHCPPRCCPYTPGLHSLLQCWSLHQQHGRCCSLLKSHLHYQGFVVEAMPKGLVYQ